MPMDKEFSIAIVILLCQCSSCDRIPFARLAAIAADKVPPVPWVFLVSILLLFRRLFYFRQKISVASSSRWPPLKHVRGHFKIILAVFHFFNTRFSFGSAASGIFGVILLPAAPGFDQCFLCRLLQWVISLLETITGSGLYLKAYSNSARFYGIYRADL